MPQLLPPETQGRLEKVLKTCVVRIELVDTYDRVAGHGTGFFVQAGRVLTCFHVVRPSLDPSAKLRLRLVRPGPETIDEVTVVDPPAPGWADLALLDVAGSYPCVVLDESRLARDTKLIAAGYPEATQVDYQVPGMVADGDGSDDEGHTYLKVREVMVEHGLSGGPVVEREGGFVCGVTRLTKGAQSAVGGFVIPVSTVLEVFPALREVHDAPVAAARPWTDALGAEHLARFNREPDGRKKGAQAPARSRPRVDLLVQGAGDPPLPRAWSVSIGFPEDAGIPAQDVRLANLGDDVIEALDRWSRRRLLEGEEEVGILGRVLYRAILPDPIAGYVRARAGEGDPMLLRLLVRPGRLSEIPWEYARPEGGTPLAADRRVWFSRFADVEGPGIEPKDRVTVLLAVVHPPAFQGGVAVGRDAPIGAEQLAEEFRQLIEEAGDRVDVISLVNPDVTKFKDRLGDVDVVHYVGYGRAIPGSDDGELAFRSRRGGADWVRPRKLVEGVPAPLAAMVLQLLVPPLDQVQVPLPSESLLPLLAHAVTAVIANQYPAPLDHLTEFASYLYEHLLGGSPLEEAVQAARIHLHDQNPRNDSTAFGMFSLTTGRASARPLLRPGPPVPDTVPLPGPQSLRGVRPAATAARAPVSETWPGR